MTRSTRIPCGFLLESTWNFFQAVHMKFGPLTWNHRESSGNPVGLEILKLAGNCKIWLGPSPGSFHMDSRWTPGEITRIPGSPASPAWIYGGQCKDLTGSTVFNSQSCIFKSDDGHEYYDNGLSQDEEY